MKITNISQVNLSFVIKNKYGVSESITLQPGKSVITGDNIVGKKLLVYEKKRLVKITKNDSPEVAVSNNDNVSTEKVQETKSKRGRPFGTKKPKEEVPKKPKGRPKGAKNKDKSSFEIAEENAEKYIKGDQQSDDI